jgi:Taurine catabolism dioxygenase TauD, TfdA family
VQGQVEQGKAEDRQPMWTCNPASRRCCKPRPPVTRRAGRPSTATRCAPWSPNTGRSWFAEAFGTDDRRAIESYCRANAIKFEWQPDGALRTWQRRSAVVRHPLTGRRCWFNQIAFLNEWTLAPEVREYLVDVYGEDGLPFNTRFGNGDPIGVDIVQTINETYDAHTVRERWEAGDLLLVDNIRTAHGREPFEGPREVVVAMADGVHLADRSPTIDVTGG